jgi:hypothetical protein
MAARARGGKYVAVNYPAERACTPGMTSAAQRDQPSSSVLAVGSGRSHPDPGQIADEPAHDRRLDVLTRRGCRQAATGSFREAQLHVGLFDDVPFAYQLVANRQQRRAEEQPQHAESGGAANHAEQDQDQG